MVDCDVIFDVYLTQLNLWFVPQLKGVILAKFPALSGALLGVRLSSCNKVQHLVVLAHIYPDVYIDPNSGNDNGEAPCVSECVA